VPFLLSNIESLIILLVAIYYCVNPCILSFPLIAFVFCYYAIATRKHVYLMVIYLFLLILAAEFLSLMVPNYNSSTDLVIKFLFDTDPDTDEVYYNQPYLYFVFVVVFLSQEIIRYKGNRYLSELEV
jgi:glucan phosphoethanolaminetransferase (alkaline phosphatase superfamily)